MLTEYDTNWVGEAEIGAWEIASGCGRYLAAWVLNLGAFGLGLAFAGDSGEAEPSFRREAERCSGMIPNTIGA